MAEQFAVENGEKLQKVPFLKIVFCNIAPLGDKKKWSHIKFKSKINYLGEKIASYQGKWLSNCQLNRYVFFSDERTNEQRRRTTVF